MVRQAAGILLTGLCGMIAGLSCLFFVRANLPARAVPAVAAALLLCLVGAGGLLLRIRAKPPGFLVEHWAGQLEARRHSGRSIAPWPRAVAVTFAIFLALFAVAFGAVYPLPESLAGSEPGTNHQR